jgi:peptidoglycan hydrolase CwlO-like protein
LEEQDLQKQLNNQQQRLTQLIEQVELTRNQLKEIRQEYQQQQDYIIQIAHHQRQLNVFFTNTNIANFFHLIGEIPKMDSRIAELKAVLQEHQQVRSQPNSSFVTFYIHTLLWTGCRNPDC